MSRQYKYPKNWFKHNLIAIPTGLAGGNCNKCLFRDKQFCEKLACVYIDKTYDNYDVESVYWTVQGDNKNISMLPDFIQFFNTLPKQQIRDISNDIMTKAVLTQKSAKNR